VSIWSKIFPKKKRSRSRLPDGWLVYAIGDIHGRFDLLTLLLEMIEVDRAAHEGIEKAYIVFLGDYVDRGRQSAEIIDFLSSYNPETMQPVFLRGNHEDLMLQFLDDPFEADLWLRVGGVATLASYGVQIDAEAASEDPFAASNALGRALPESHRAFLEGLTLHWQAGDYLFVHAGIRPGVPLAEQKRRDLLGIRQGFTSSSLDHGFRVVHGHTGVREPEFMPNRIAIDTGAFATGVLTAAIFFGAETDVLQTP